HNDLTEGSLQRSADWRGRQILELHTNLDVSVRCIGKWQRRHYLWVANLHVPGRSKNYRLPEAGVAVANSRNPIPAFRCHKGGAIQAHDPTVLAGTTFDGLLVRNSRMRRRRNPHRENILSIGVQNIGHVKSAANECSFDRAEASTIQPDLCAIVNAFEGQREAASLYPFGCAKFNSIPVVLFVQAFWDCKIVQTVIGIGIDAAIDHRR